MLENPAPGRTRPHVVPHPDRRRPSREPDPICSDCETTTHILEAVRFSTWVYFHCHRCDAIWRRDKPALLGRTNRIVGSSR